MEKENGRNFRSIVSFVLIIAIFLTFTGVLYYIQILHGDEYKDKGAALYSGDVTVESARGVILDRNGKPLVTNRQGNAIVFRNEYFPSSSNQKDRNEIIHSLIQVFEKNGEEWIDNLPLIVDASGKIAFAENRESDIKTMKSADMLNLNDYATAQNCMDALIEKYELEGYSLTDARKIASVCYEMKRLSFNISIPYTFADDVSNELVAYIKERSSFYRGVDSEIVSYREYADGTFAPHIIGMVGAINAEEYAELKSEGYGMNDIIGKNGLEKALEKYLKGTDGKKTVTVDSNGNVVSKITVEPIQGNTVVTTIDYDLQMFIQDKLAEVLKNEKTEVYPAGCIVVVNVKTGEVLASASYPTYDISTYKENATSLNTDETAPLWNRALNTAYEPGSTIKMSVAIAALEEGFITDETTVNCYGHYKYLDTSFKCERSHSTIRQDVYIALAESCNSFFYYCGEKLGYEVINEYRTLLGLGQQTGIELNEALGVQDSPSYRESVGDVWYAGYNIQTAIGQGNLFTPIQLANYCATIANGGKRNTLHFVKSVKSYDYSETVYDTEASYSDTGISKETINIVKKGMYRAAKSGYSATAYSKLDFDVGCKSGTSQVVRKINGSYKQINNGLFVTFAPYDDPEIAICLVGEGFSSPMSLAYASADIYDYYFSETGSSNVAESVNTLLG